MKKRLATGYTFDASAQTIVHADFSDITLEGILMIINVTDQIIIYNFADTAKGGTLSTDTLTLEYDTTAMDDADKLMILVEDGSDTQPVSFTGSTDVATQTTLAALNAKLVTGTVIGDVNLGATDNAVLDDIAAKLGTIDADTGAIKTAVELIDNAISGSEMQVDVVAALPAGTNAIGKLAANSGVDIGDVDVTSIAFTAATPYQLVSAATTNATSLKASAGVIYGIQCSNVNAAARYLKLYNKASAPTVGTDTPVHTFIIPGNTAGAGTNIPISVRGMNFSTGIAFALTTESTVAGTTAVAASEIVVNIDYI